MTRKRFVKLLMADGYSRNKANSIAKQTVADGDTYDLQLVYLRVGNNFPDVALPELKAAIGKVADMVAEILPTIINTIVEMLPVAIDLAHQHISTLQKEMEATTNE